MKTLSLTRKADVPRPMGNPFLVYPHRLVGVAEPFLDTGLHIELPDELTLQVESLTDGTVKGWKMKDTLLVAMSFHSSGHPKDQPFAKVFIVERPIIPCRFAETAAEGGRVIAGDAEQVRVNG